MKHHFYTALVAFAFTSSLALVQPAFAQIAGGAPAGGSGTPAATGTTGSGGSGGTSQNGHHGKGNGQGQGQGKGAGHEACQRILAACEQHGFIKGQWKKDNGLYKDCFDPIVNGGGITQDGKTVSVSVSQGDVSACREAKEHHQGQGKGHQGQGSSGTSSGSGSSGGSGVTPDRVR